jgi:hypothetical protein
MNFDIIGAETLGFNWMDLAKGAAGVASGAGGLLSPKKEDSAAEAQRRRLEEEKRRAEESASQMKIVALAAGAMAVALGVRAIVGRR